MPEIVDGVSERSCSLAIFTLMDAKSFRNWQQQSGRPQFAMPPRMAVSSRTPIWRSSMCVLNSCDSNFTSSRKSTRPSALNCTVMSLPSYE